MFIKIISSGYLFHPYPLSHYSKDILNSGLVF